MGLLVGLPLSMCAGFQGVRHHATGKTANLNTGTSGSEVGAGKGQMSWFEPLVLCLCVGWWGGVGCVWRGPTDGHT